MASEEIKNVAIQQVNMGYNASEDRLLLKIGMSDDAQQRGKFASYQVEQSVAAFATQAQTFSSYYCINAGTAWYILVK